MGYAFVNSKCVETPNVAKMKDHRSYHGLINSFELRLNSQRHEVPSVHISGFASLNCATQNLLMEDMNECKNHGLYHL